MAPAPPTSCHLLSLCSFSLFLPNPSKVPTSPNFPRTLGRNSEPRRLAAERDSPSRYWVPPSWRNKWTWTDPASGWTMDMGDPGLGDTPLAVPPSKRQNSAAGLPFPLQPGWACKQACWMGSPEKRPRLSVGVWGGRGTRGARG